MLYTVRARESGCAPTPLVIGLKGEGATAIAVA